MNEHMLADVFIVVSLVLVVGLLFMRQERNHWRDSYEALRNETLAEGQKRTRVVIAHMQDTTERMGITLDEMIDLQG